MTKFKEDHILHSDLVNKFQKRYCWVILRSACKYMCWYNCIIEKSSDSEKKQSIFSYPTTQFHGESQTIHSETISSKEYLSSQKSILQKNFKTILHRAKQRHLESIRTLSCGSTKWINLFASRHEVHGTNQWWSLETWSPSRDSFLWVLVSKVSGLVSVSKATGLATLNIAKKGFFKFL